MQVFSDSFALAGLPQATVGQLIQTCDEFSHLGQAQIACIFSERQLFLHGGPCAALITTGAHTQGPCRHLVDWLLVNFVEPLLGREPADFYILIDRTLWDSLDLERRERLCYHELLHIRQVEDEFGTPRINRQTGAPVLKLAPHDAELFHAELERYGVEVCNAEGTAIAIAAGERNRLSQTA